MMQHEFVTRRGWLTNRRFLDLMGVTNLIPGPNSTEMALHIGRERGGWIGLIGAGIAFIMPASILMTGLAWAYVEFGSAPTGAALLYGIKPVVIAIVIHAIYKLGRSSVRSWRSALITTVVVTLGLFGVNEFVLLVGSGGVGAMMQGSRRLLGKWTGALIAPFIGFTFGLATPVNFSLLNMALHFTKISVLLYGSGYVLLSFLRSEFVNHFGWITETQLLDAVAIGHVTPGPVFTTATFIGFLLAGVPGAIIGTVAIFLPSFVFVAAVNPLVHRIRKSTITAPILDAVNAAAIGLMTVVTLHLSSAALTDGTTVLIGFTSLIVLTQTKINSFWLILVGALLGTLAHQLAG